MAARIARFSAATVAGGMPGGPMMANQFSRSKPGSAPSASVGTSGKEGKRSRPVTAIRFTRPSRAWPAAEASTATPHCVSPRAMDSTISPPER